MKCTWLSIALKLKPQLSVMDYKVLCVLAPDHLGQHTLDANLCSFLSKHMDPFYFYNILGCSHPQQFDLALFSVFSISPQGSAPVNLSHPSVLGSNISEERSSGWPLQGSLTPIFFDSHFLFSLHGFFYHNYFASC